MRIEPNVTALNIAIKVVALCVLCFALVTLWNVNRIAATGKAVSDEAGGDAKLILKEATSVGLEALRERREKIQERSK
jgi:hypothetical protein